MAFQGRVFIPFHFCNFDLSQVIPSMYQRIFNLLPHKHLRKSYFTKRILLLGFFFVFLTGCTTSRTAPTFVQTPIPAPQNDMAVLYLFRGYAEPTAFAAHITIDQSEVASLNQEGFTWVYVKAGQHDFSVDWSSWSGVPSLQFKHSLEAGHFYAFQVLGHVKMLTPNVVSNAAITRLGVEEAQDRMKACCRYVPPTQIK